MAASFNLPPSTAWGQPVEVSLDSDGIVNANWTVHWGDGAVSQVSGGLATAKHSYLDANLTAANVRAELYRADGSFVGFSADQISAAADGTLFAKKVDQSIHRWDGDQWTPLPLNFKQFSAVSATEIWGVDSAGSLTIWNGTTTVSFGTRLLTHVSAATDGTAYGIDTANRVVKRSGNDWVTIGGVLKSVTAWPGGNAVGVNSSNNAYYKTNTGNWIHFGSAMTDVTTGVDGRPFAVKSNGDVQEYNNVGGWSWKTLPTPKMRSISAMNSSGFWGIDQTGAVIRWNGYSTAKLPTLVGDIAVGRLADAPSGITGPDAAAWGQPVDVSLDSLGIENASWVVNWGDGRTSTTTAGADTAEHAYFVSDATTVEIAAELYRPDGSFVGLQAAQVSAGNDGSVFAREEDGSVYRLDDSSWTELPFRFAQISARSSSELWGLDYNGNVFVWNGVSMSTFGTRQLRQLSVAPDGSAWGIDLQGAIVNRNQNGWTAVSGIVPFSDISAGVGNWVVGLSQSGEFYYRSGNGWAKANGVLRDISIGDTGGSNYFAVNHNNDLYQWNGNGGWNWKYRNYTKLRSISMGSGQTFWGIDTSGAVVHWDGTQLTKVPTFTKSLDVSAFDSQAAGLVAVQPNRLIPLESTPSTVRLTLSTASGLTAAAPVELLWSEAAGAAVHWKPSESNPDIIELVHDDETLASISVSAALGEYNVLKMDFLVVGDDGELDVQRTDYHSLLPSTSAVVMVNPNHATNSIVAPLRSELDLLQSAAQVVSGAQRDAIKAAAITTTQHYAAADFFQRLNRSLDARLGAQRWASSSSVMVQSQSIVDESTGGDFFFLPRYLQIQLPHDLAITADREIDADMAGAIAGDVSAAVSGTINQIAGSTAGGPKAVFDSAIAIGQPIRQLVKNNTGQIVDQVTEVVHASPAGHLVASATVQSAVQGLLDEGFRVDVPQQSQTLSGEVNTYNWTGNSLQASRAVGNTATVRLPTYNDGQSWWWTGGFSRVYANRNVTPTLPGKTFRSDTDLVASSIGIGVSVARQYESGRVATGPAASSFGPGWTFGYGAFLDTPGESNINETQFTWNVGDGTTRRFEVFGSASTALINFISPDEKGISATRSLVSGQYEYTITTKDHSQIVFQAATPTAARLHTIKDRNDNRHQVVYAGGKISQVQDITQAAAPITRLTFTHIEDRISTITDDAGRAWTYHYARFDGSPMMLSEVTGPSSDETPAQSLRYRYDWIAGSPRLKTAVDTSGQETQYQYTPNGRLRQTTGPYGVSQQYVYDDFASTVSVSEPTGHVTDQTYDTLSRLIKVVRADGSVERFTYDGDSTRVQYRRTEGGSTTTIYYDDRGNVQQTITDGLVTWTNYHASFNIPKSVFQKVDGETKPAKLVFSNEFDMRGNVTETNDPLGNKSTSRFNSRGLLESQTTPRGNTTLAINDFTTWYTYNDRGQLTAKFGPVETPNATVASETFIPTLANPGNLPVERFQYDAYGNLQFYTNPEGIVAEYEYDFYGRVTKTTTPDPHAGTPDAIGPVIGSSTYDEYGRLETQTSPDGVVTTYGYNEAGRVTSVTTADLTSSYEYDEAGQVLVSRDVGGDETWFQYDGAGRVIATVRPDETAQFTRYDAQDRIVETRDAVGSTTSWEYDDVERTISTRGTSGGVVTEQYDVFGNLASKTSVSGAVTTYAYDLANRVTKVQFADQWVKTIDYNAEGLPTETALFDIAGLDSGAIPVDLTQLPANRIRLSTVGYDVNGQLNRWTDAEGNVSSAQYNSAGQMTSQTSANGLQQNNVYGSSGAVAEVHTIDTVGTIYHAATTAVKNVYDVRGRVSSRQFGVKQADGTFVFLDLGSVDHDLSSLTTTVTDPLNRSSTTEYSVNGRQTITTDATGRIVTSSFDSAGRPLTHSFQATESDGEVVSRQVSYQYDDAGRLSSWTDPLGGVSSVVYDALGNSITKLSPELVAGDEASRLTSRKEYNDAGQLVRAIDAAGNVTSYDYDSLGRLQTTTLPDPDGPAKPLPAPTMTNHYNGFGEITSQTDHLGRTTAFTYDVLGRLKTHTTVDPDGTGPLTAQTTTRHYDAAGNLSSVVDGAGRVTSWTYDTLGRVRVETLPDPDPSDNRPAPTRSFTYNDDGQLSKSIDVTGGVTDYFYDQFGRELYRDLPLADVGSARARIQRGYDADGRLEFLIDPLGAKTSMTYNATGQLETITYPDPDGPTNPVTLAGSLPAATRTYTYDSAGRVESFIDSSGATTSYTYDAVGRPKSQTAGDPDGDGPLAAFTTTWFYDAVGNLLRTEDSLGRTQAAETLYDALGRETKITLIDPDLTIADDIPVIEKSYDAAGNLASVTDAVGSVTTFQYDAWGRQTRQIGPPVDGVSAVTEYRYDQAGNLEFVIDPRGYQTQHIYDAWGRVTETVYPDPDFSDSLPAPRVSQSYDDAGRIATDTDPAGRMTTYVYDGRGNLVKTVYPHLDRHLSGNVLDVSFDASGTASVLDTDDNEVGQWTGALPAPVVDGPVGDAMQFTPSTGEVTFPATPELDGLGRNDADFSMAFWLRLDESNVGKWRQILSKGNVSSQRGPAIFAQPYNNRLHVRLSTDHSFNEGLDSTVSLQVDRWTHVAVVKEGRQWSLYLDGVLNSTTTLLGASLGNNAPLVIGSNSTYPAKFSIDEMAVIDRAFSPNEIDRLVKPIASTRTEYDLARRAIATYDTLDRQTRYTYDAVGRVTSVILPAADGSRDPDGTSSDGPTSTNIYDDDGNLFQFIDVLGRVTEYQYDDWGREVKRTLPDPDAGGPLPAPSITTVYDAAGNLFQTIDHLGRATTTVYDRLDRPTTTTLPDPNSADGFAAPSYSTKYYKDGAVDKQIDIAGRVTDFDFDARGRVSKTTLPDPDPTDNSPAPFTEQTYDAVGNVLTRTDEDGATATWTYDALGRTISETLADPDAAGSMIAPQTVYAYDAAGNQASRSVLIGDGQWLTTTYSYDAWNRQTTVTAPEGDVTTYRYDTGGSLLSLTDATGNETSYVYDSLGQQIEAINENGDSRFYVYDDAGRLTQRTDRNGRVTTYTHDDLDRIKSEVWIENDANGDTTIASTYNAAGLLASIGDGYHTDTFVYDAGDRLTSRTRSGSGLTTQHAFGFTYLAGGNVDLVTQSVVGNADVVTDYDYDGAGQVKQITQSGASVVTKRVEYERSAHGQVTGSKRFAGLNPLASVDTTVARDAIGRKTEITHRHAGADLAGYTYTYDALSRTTAVDSLIDGLTSIGLDDNGRLTTADHAAIPDESFDYDATGNRIDADNVIGANNRLLDDGVFTYQYDSEGNRVGRIETATGVRTAYTYDFRNRLTWVRTYTAGGVLIDSAEYRYDTANQRIARAVDADGSGYADTIERFVVDGDTVTAVVNPQGDIDRQYFHGASVDEVLAEETIGGVVTWTLADGQGTIRDLARDVAGATAVVNHRVYDSFGNLHSQTNAAVDHLFGYTGRDFDEQTGLHYYRDRWMDPVTATFLSEDPIGFDGGDVNLVNYVGGAPYDYTDPTGNSWVSSWLKKGEREVRRVRDQVEDVLEEAWDDTEDFFSDTWDWVEDNPWETVAIIAAATFAWYAAPVWAPAVAGGFKAAAAKLGTSQIIAGIKSAGSQLASSLTVTGPGGGNIVGLQTGFSFGPGAGAAGSAIGGGSAAGSGLSFAASGLTVSGGAAGGGLGTFALKAGSAIAAGTLAYYATASSDPTNSGSSSSGSPATGPSSTPYSSDFNVQLSYQIPDPLYSQSNDWARNSYRHPQNSAFDLQIDMGPWFTSAPVIQTPTMNSAGVQAGSTGGFFGGVSGIFRKADQFGGRVAGMLLGVDVPMDGASLIGIQQGALRGTGTGTKAITNSVVSSLTIGFVPEAIEPNEFDRSVGYDSARLVTQVISEVVVGAGLGGVSTASRLGRAAFAFDVAGNAVGVGRGASSIYDEGGLTVGNSIEVVSSLAGLGSNYVVGAEAMHGFYDTTSTFVKDAARANMSHSGTASMGIPLNLSRSAPQSVGNVADNVVVPQRAYQSGARMADSQLLRVRTNTRHTQNITEWRRTVWRSDIGMERTKFLGTDAVKIDAGTWRSLDGTRQFRTVPNDYLGRHGIGQPSVPNTPHVHFEFLAPPNAGGANLRVLKNVHVPLSN